MGDFADAHHRPVRHRQGARRPRDRRCRATSRSTPRTRRFAEDSAGSFHALNLSALSPTLIESELFGHRRGAFTGALEDRAGWLEVCPPLGTVFLDEIGELDPAIQVKLLRVLQTRTLPAPRRHADARHFEGKIIAATNRDLAPRWRPAASATDFYYRLCADLIRTPTLREQLARLAATSCGTWCCSSPAARGRRGGASAWPTRSWRWIDARTSAPDYAWPGNFRELEQCVRRTS